MEDVCTLFNGDMEGPVNAKKGFAPLFPIVALTVGIPLTWCL